MSNANSLLLTITASAMLLLVPNAVPAGNAQIWWSGAFPGTVHR